FHSANPHAAPNDFGGTIHWGDGSVSQSADMVFVQIGDGTFSVKGQHTYAKPARHLPFQVEINDTKDGASLVTPKQRTVPVLDGHRNLVITQRTTPVEVDVADAPLKLTVASSLPSFVEGKPVPFFQIATLTDNDPKADLKNYHATVNWGDGMVSGSDSVHPD